MLTTKLQLIVDDPKLVRATIDLFVEVCNYVSVIAHREQCFNWLRLRYRVYYECRETFPDASSQFIVMAVRRVARAYQRKNRKKTIIFKAKSVTFNPNQFHLDLEKQLVSLQLLGGRQKLSFQTGDRQRQILKGKWREAQLIERRRKFYLNITCDADAPTPVVPLDFLGCDLGIVNLLTDSDGDTYSGDRVSEKRRIYQHRRGNLQRKGTRSAKRKLQSIKGKQSRYQKDVNHCISKRVVQKAKDTARGIALEDLSGIRERVTVRRRQRSQHANWGFYQLRAFIEYKAALGGIPVVVVDPSKTSQMCSACGHIEKGNRVSQSDFKCKLCGYVALADFNAARNIRARAGSDQPMVAANYVH